MDREYGRRGTEDAASTRVLYVSDSGELPLGPNDGQKVTSVLEVLFYQTSELVPTVVALILRPKSDHGVVSGWLMSIALTVKTIFVARAEEKAQLHEAASLPRHTVKHERGTLL